MGVIRGTVVFLILMVASLLLFKFNFMVPGIAPFSHVLARGYLMVLAYLCLEVFLMKVALRRAKRKGTLLKLSE